MNAYALSHELAEIQARTRKTGFVSLGVHALLFLLFALRHTIVPPAPALTEVSWIDPVTIQPPVPVATAKPQPRAERVVRTSPQQNPKHFVRETSESDFTPRPQQRNAMEDLLERKRVSSERTAIMQASIVDIAAPAALARPALAGVPNEESPGRNAVALTRSENSSPAPIALARSEPRRARAAAPSSIPERPVAAAEIDRTDSSARRIIDGASLVGPVADRVLLSYRTPDYPDWAKNDGVEATLTLYFIVLPNGRVKENILVEKTSGFGDFDKNAVDALVGWRFEPLKSGEIGEQWGLITFNFRLAD